MCTQPPTRRGERDDVPLVQKDAASSDSHASAFWIGSALSFLICVAVVKTLLTKMVFVHVGNPVAFSLLSCVATTIWLLPIFAFRPKMFHMLRPHMLPKLSVVWLADGLDLGLMNIAFSELSVALAQCLRAGSPVVTVIIETAYRKVQQPESKAAARAGGIRWPQARVHLSHSRPPWHPGTTPAQRCSPSASPALSPMQVRHHPLVYGSLVVLALGAVLSKMGSSAYDASTYGIIAMIFGLLASSSKYVFMKVRS